MDRTKGFIALSISAVILGAFGVFLKELSNGFSDPAAVFIRSFVATLIIVAIVLYKKFNPLRVKKEYIGILVLFSLAFPLSLLFMTISINLIKVANSLFMLYVGSLATTAILGKLLFMEKFTLKHILSLILVVVGLSFFIYPFDINVINYGIIAGILAGVFEGVCHILRKKMANISREVIVFYQSISGVVFAVFLLFFYSEPFIKEFQVSAVAAGLILGLMMVAIGYLLAYGFANYDANLGTILLATELFFALVLNAIFLKEFATVTELIGGVIIFLGAVVVSININIFKRKGTKLSLNT